MVLHIRVQGTVNHLSYQCWFHGHTPIIRDAGLGTPVGYRFTPWEYTIPGPKTCANAWWHRSKRHRSGSPRPGPRSRSIAGAPHRGGTLFQKPRLINVQDSYGVTQVCGHIPDQRIPPQHSRVWASTIEQIFKTLPCSQTSNWKSTAHIAFGASAAVFWFSGLRHTARCSPATRHAIH